MLADQIIACSGVVPLVEEEIDGDQDSGQAFCHVAGFWSAVGDLGDCDLAAGSGQSFGHGRLGYEQRTSDFGNRKTAQGVKGKRRLSLQSKGRMTAGEDETEEIVVGVLIIGDISS